MKISSLHLKAFGPFTDRVVDFGGPAKSLVVVYGPNEAGKSAMLRAIEALRYQIHGQSPDNFLHEHPDMCVGAILLKSDSTTPMVMRIKRPKDSLFLANALGGGSLEATKTQAPSGLQDALTGGLGQDEYRRMFGLNHEVLRAGGQRLARGEVEVGTSLFEASLGIRDVTAIAQELDERARELFMPGARGTKGRINEALKKHKDLQRQVKEAMVKPRDWQDKFNASERAGQEVQRLNAEQAALNARQKLLATLRAAAPVIQDLDAAQAALTELEAVPDLPEGVGQTRTAAQASLLAAQEALAAATQAARDAQQQLDTLTPDPNAIGQSAAIGRLIAKAEEVDNLRRLNTELEQQGAAQLAEAKELAAAIETGTDPKKILGQAPAKARAAEIEQRVQAFVSAQQALQNHNQSAPQDQDDDTDGVASLPAEAVIRQLRHALADLERERNTLARLRALPADIAAAEQAMEHQVLDLGLEGEADLDAVRPLLDADIDEAAQALQDNISNQQRLRDRIGQIEPELRAAREQRDRMREDQAVVTSDDVLLARARRDQGWQFVRATYVDQGAAVDPQALSDFTGNGVLPEAYEEAVRLADGKADGYARDTKAAAELKAKHDEIARYERDVQTLRDDLTRQVTQGGVLADTWSKKLQANGLARRAPSALREWQGLLKAGREGRAALQRLQRELAQAQQVEAGLTNALRCAAQAVDVASASEVDPLASLETIAREHESRIQREQRAADENRARRHLLDNQKRQRAGRLVELEEKLAETRSSVEAVAAELLLPQDASPAAIHARVQEFADLCEAWGQVGETQGRLELARANLAQIASDAHVVAQALQAQPPQKVQGLRPWFDQLEERRTRATETHTAQQAATRELITAQTAARTQETAIEKHATQLRGLCDAAGVADVDLLADVEARAERKRQASANKSRCLQHLRSFSDQTLEQLREHLAAQDGAALQAQQEQGARDLQDIAPRLEAVRSEAERTKRELEAIDASGTAAQAQEDLCQTAATIEASLRPWMRLRLAHSLLMQAQRRFQERAQGPMLERASGYFQRMTDGAFTRLKTDATADKQVLLAERVQGGSIGTEAMSEGTRDQLYLALRLAAVSLRRDAGVDLPMVLDDVLMTSSDGRAGCVLQALADFSRGSQVLVFTHHEHLLDIARRSVASEELQVVSL
ncbi:YhaN family protein [Ramlibacter sp. WS9]|uniref:ATP-binding protein n=1 Tax=Ramlibacter sp. WS9 TaxID=1882741 RepID=UPI001143E4A0|nr:YhaN family protein [Ramlibacter sp. WS9]ROZ78008.1 hypothetical protein EEB15_05995 [Ramlibacter sp. WS9]